MLKLSDLLSFSLPLILWKSATQKVNGWPKHMVKVNMHDLNDKVKILDLLNGAMFLAEAGHL